MSRSDWGNKFGLAVIAIILIAVWTIFIDDVTHRKTKNDIQTNHDSRHYTKHTKGQVKALCSGIDIPSLAIDCAITQYEASRDAERSEKDLGAQQAMAEWAYLMVMVSGATFIITAFGAFLIWRTLIATQQTADAMVAASNIEAEPFLSIEIMHEDKISATRNGFEKNGESLSEIWLEIVNKGKSPAIVTGLHRDWFVGDEANIPIPNIGEKRREYKTNNIPIGGGGRSGPIRCNAIHFKYPKGEVIGQIYFLGYIQFIDMNDIEYVSRFTLILAEGRFHIAWPIGSPEKYNYHSKVEA